MYDQYNTKDEMAYAVNERGRVISFHMTNIMKNHFERPSYKYHTTCEKGVSSAKFYKTMEKWEHHKNDCHRCQMYKFKKTVARFKSKRENI